MIARVVPELSKKKKTPPLLRGIMDCTAKEHLKALVYLLTLAVCLGVVCCHEFQLCAQMLEQLLLEMACEDVVTV
jgi:hypothetical protein